MNASVVIPPSLNTFPLELNALFKFLSALYDMCVTMKNKLVFNITWTYIFAVNIRNPFGLFLPTSPWAESHPWVWLVPQQKHLLRRGVRGWSHISCPAGLLSRPQSCRGAALRVPIVPREPLERGWVCCAPPARRRCRERARAAAPAAPRSRETEIGKSCRERSSRCSWLCWKLLSLPWGFAERSGIGSSADILVLQMLRWARGFSLRIQNIKFLGISLQWDSCLF